MRVETFTGLVYDEADPQCLCHLFTSQGKAYGFIQAIDTGFDGQQRYPARYWGEYCHDAPEASIHRILSSGGKWPQLPGGES
ncbi:hypothetical protein [Billgrantia gudaonensis]|uniref:Uncharacterized protein n=1 Tax=Billgrantia gudaonensis TaxID=376427 RepID=A0A1G8R1F2_9GAMM|nr:hypothetical protein [Halomonas gudaonensis]SDJ10804.1 hypothetical protein SAMN04487954_10360 [Halomonas gudaonensis]